MATTPQTNSTLEDIAQVIRANSSFVLCGHVSPDGDCLGSQLALHHTLKALGKESTLLLVRDDVIDQKLAFMPGADGFVPAQHMLDELPETGQAFDVFIGLDVPKRDRVGQAACSILDRCADSVTIDHHAEPSTMANHVHVEPDSASTSIMVWRLCKLLLDTPPVESAVCAYTGLVTDTGGFQFQNTNTEAFLAAADLVAAGVKPFKVSREITQNESLAAIKLQSLAIERMILLQNGQIALSWITADDMRGLNAQKADADGVVGALRSIRGVRVACALREQDGEVRGNLRSKDDSDVSVVAREFDGGGHRGAAGFKLKLPMEDAVSAIEDRLSRFDFDQRDA